MLRKVLCVEKLKFEFYHMRWKKLLHFLNSHFNLYARFNEWKCEPFILNNMISCIHVMHRSCFLTIINIWNRYCGNLLWVKFYAANGVPFYPAYCVSQAFYLYACMINWALILKHLYFYRDMYVRGRIKFLVYLSISLYI